MDNKTRNYQLVIQFTLTNAGADVFDHIIMIEKELGLTLTDRHQLDEHTFGEDTVSILINTTDPAEAFELAKKELSEEDLGVISVAIKNSKSDRYTVIWPENYQGEFKINKEINTKPN